jgi:hypothetical protein
VDYAIAFLTLALVVITGYYAWQTREMATEKREARLRAVLPHLVLDLEMITPLFAMVVVQNAGLGPALQCDLELTLAGTDEDRRKWRPHLIAPAERHEFLPPDGVGSLDDLAARYARVTLTGSFFDSIGRVHQVDAAMDVAASADVLRETRHRFERPTSEQLVKEVRKAQEHLDHLVDAFRRFLNRPPQP